MAGEDSSPLTVVIPTYNERSNVPRLLLEFSRVKQSLPIPFKIVIVDDASPDGTEEIALELGDRYGLRVEVHIREGTRGLGTAIATGLGRCDSELICVMDADLSHPPDLLPTLLERLNGFDGAVASRYTRGGRIARWPFHRRIISIVATKMAQSALKTLLADPLSGYFLFRNSAIQNSRVTGMGNKPLLEILGQRNLAIYEVPYEFSNRAGGKSKLTLRAIFEYIVLILRLRLMRSSHPAPAKPETEKSATLVRNS